MIAGIVSGGRFLQPANLVVILFQSSVVGVLVLGQDAGDAGRRIDLSIVAVAVLAAVVMGAAGSERQIMMDMSGFLPYLGVWPSIALALLGAAAVGLVNGLAVVRFRIPAFIATLAMSLALAGIAMLATGGSPVHYPDAIYTVFGQTKLLGLPLPGLCVRGAGRHLAVVLLRTRLRGRALRHRRQSARRRPVGHPVGRVTVLAYTLCGLLGGIAGFLFLARTGSVSPSSGGGLLLSTVAAVVVGGRQPLGRQGLGAQRRGGDAAAPRGSPT